MTITETITPLPTPPPPPAPVQLPSPPATPIRTTPLPRTPPVEKPAAPVDFSLPPVHQQEYGPYTIGGRRQPVHESQKKQAANYLKSPVTPRSPAPAVRLGGAIQPNSPSPRPSPSPVVSVPVGDLRSGLRRTGGPRRSIPSRTESEDGSELRAQLARRRTWSPKDQMVSSVSITPSESASNMPSRASSPTGSDLSRTSTPGDLPPVSEIDEKRRKA
jgi:hypothetical protein